MLTFDYSRQPVVAADLVLCGPVVAHEARETDAGSATTPTLLVHGTLRARLGP